MWSQYNLIEQVRYNQKRVDTYSQYRIRRRIFRAWKAYFRIQLKVRGAQRKRCAFICQTTFVSWKDTAKKQRALRWITYNNWKAYPRLIMQGPFQSELLNYFIVSFLNSYCLQKITCIHQIFLFSNCYCHLLVLNCY